MLPIIILNWNGLEDTQACLASLEEQSYQDFEVYLVDNGSAQEEVEALQKSYANHPQIRLICNPENRGFTLANNQVLRDLLPRTEAPYVLLLNNDTVAEPDFLEQMLQAASQQKADMVSARMVNYYQRDRMDNAGHSLLNTLEVLPIGNDEPVEQFGHSFENWGACGGAALYASEMLREIGIFDERFRNGYEDVELGLRAVLCGYRSCYAPRAVVYHKVSRSINKIRDFAYTLSIQRHVYYLMVKLFPLPVLLACLPFVLLRLLAALLINLLSLRVKFLRIQLAALGCLFGKDWRSFVRARRSFQRQQQLIGSWQIMKRMQFFLKKDWQRFVKYIWRREKMVFEKY
jgi:GT2 family glycosyltransferase